MVINGMNLYSMLPIKNMFLTKQKEHGVSYGMSEAGYDIRIKQDIWFTSTRDDRMCVQIDNEDPVAGRFILASAIEEFQMPNNLVGVIHDKSTWARKGLSVFNTVAEPGWNGFLTLELVYHGSKDLHIPAGAGIAQVIFNQTELYADYGNGKYQNQEDKPVKSRKS